MQEFTRPVIERLEPRLVFDGTIELDVDGSAAVRDEEANWTNGSISVMATGTETFGFSTVTVQASGSAQLDPGGGIFGHTFFTSADFNIALDPSRMGTFGATVEYFHDATTGELDWLADGYLTLSLAGGTSNVEIHFSGTDDNLVFTFSHQEIDSSNFSLSLTIPDEGPYVTISKRSIGAGDDTTATRRRVG